MEVQIQRGAAGGLPSFPKPAEVTEAYREGGLAALVQSSEQRGIMRRLQATMAVVEGYSEHVMDAVGADVLPGYERMREAMDRRRQSRSAPQRILERLLGLELKMRQYVVGKRFCDAVVESSGIAVLNRVWEAEQYLPTLAELDEPAAWVARGRAGARRRLSGLAAAPLKASIPEPFSGSVLQTRVRGYILKVVRSNIVSPPRSRQGGSDGNTDPHAAERRRQEGRRDPQAHHREPQCSHHQPQRPHDREQRCEHRNRARQG